LFTVLLLLIFWCAVAGKQTVSSMEFSMDLRVWQRWGS